MNSTELKAVCALAAIYLFRMLGLFMVLPVLALYTDNLQGATPALIGTALGMYGLVQGLLQLPYGIISDHLGRKQVIIFGLTIFIIGSIVAALSTSIYGVIVGRALQGAGAIGSVLLAFVSDVTRVEVRTKAMAIIGITIGSSFTVALLLGPLLDAWVHLAGLFWFTAILGVLGIGVILLWVPTPPLQQKTSLSIVAQFTTTLKNKQLWELDFGIFALHLILTATFVAVPFMLEQQLGIAETKQMWLYIPVLLFAFIAMLPLLNLIERRQKLIPVFISAVVGLMLSQLLLSMFSYSPLIVGCILWVFFTAFSTLEATLPSLVSKLAPATAKGAAMGVYSTSQFIGIFVGGIAGGWIFGHYQTTGVFLFCAAVALVWLAVMGLLSSKFRRAMT